ncbi:MAG: hypothetical protein DMF54_10095 [Acidobacteria bacterium]|nr:MAG: hypothetical protein DMF54_10095 [Acidobacteriota bacterium]
MVISRRDFLLRTSGFVTVSAMVPRWAVDGSRLFEESIGADFANRTLVVLELAGGNDDLNTVVPYSDNLYTQMRSRIGIAPGSVLQLDGRLGLNPVMTGLKALWDHNRVALLENVGYPNSSLSHFAARDVWHTADPQLAQRNGWLGRWADRYIAASGNPLACTAISQSLPRTLLSDSVGVPSFVNLASYQYATDGSFPGDRSNQIRTFLTQNGAEYEIENTPDALSRVAEDAIHSSDMLQTVGSGYVPGGVYPAGTLGAGLLLIAQIINANLGARILYITYGGFDNHATENSDHDPLLTNVSAGIQAFFDDLDAHGKAHDVLLMTWSEFGRRVADNGSNGTDHGTAAAHFVVGNAVRPGIYGGPPNLANLDSNGNRTIENDFRAYYGTILQDWLGADSAAILGTGYPNLGFVNRSYA